jgi:signal transduction histidine kinase
VRPAPIGIRWQTTAVATAVVGLALLAGAYGLFATTRGRIEQSIIAAAEGQVAAVVAAGGMVESTAPPVINTQILVQVLDERGEVLDADPLIAGLGPLVTLDLAPGQDTTVRVPDLFEGSEGRVPGLEDSGPYAIVARGADLASGRGIVLAAASLEDAVEAGEAMGPALWVGIPLIVALAGLTTWLLTGWSLRPVAAMSREAQRISSEAMDLRLPVPSGKDELSQLAATLNDMLARLQSSALRQSQFIADASHEIRSPLASLRTMVEVASLEGSISEVEAAALLEQIGRIEQLSADLLYLAAADEGRQAFHSQPVDLGRIAQQELAALGRVGGLQVDIGGIVPVAMKGDPGRLGQLVRNLVDNAARHASTCIWLETAANDGVAILTVSDDGSGIPLADRARIFERFVRLDEGRARHSGGTGLGLAVARVIATEHGGRLDVIDPRHGGATFEARLPML